jgi:hypothetical protein
MSDEDAVRRLLATLLLRAVEDAQGDDPFRAAEGRRYLEGQGGDFAAMLGIRTGKVRAWLEKLAQVEGDLARCVYPEWKAADLLGMSLTQLRKLKGAGILIPDAPEGKYSAVVLLEFLGGGDERDGDRPSPPTVGGGAAASVGL